MFIHFSFGKYKDNTLKQTDKLVNKVLEKKRLWIRENPEFIPVFPPEWNKRLIGEEIYHIELESFAKNIVKNNYGAKADLNKIKTFSPQFNCHYLRENIGMICFIKISINELKKSSHINQYGKLGLVFDNRYLRLHGIRQVEYYEEDTVFKDPLIIEWNNKYAYNPSLSDEENKAKRELEKRILAFRKPEMLFPSFSESRLMKMERTKDGFNVEIEDAYSRYQIGYNFKKENEWRIISEECNKYLYFDEKDLILVLVPDITSLEQIKKYIDSNWSNKPNVLICPNA